MKSQDTPKILEVNFRPYFSEDVEGIEFLDVGFLYKKGNVYRNIVQSFKVLILRAFKQDFDILITKSVGQFVYRRELNILKNWLRYFFSWLTAKLVIYATRGDKKLVVLDMNDEYGISSRDKKLLEKCDVYFKREYPLHPMQLVRDVISRKGERIKELNTEKVRKLIDKTRPISIGFVDNRAHGEIRIDKVKEFESLATIQEKKYDVFFSGYPNSYVRTRAHEALDNLKELGYKVYVPDKMLSVADYWQALRDSWLCLSPEGAGWECYRHYEIAMAQSVPVINYGCIRRYQPLKNEIHSLYYEADIDGDLEKVVENALKNKEELLRLAGSARTHVLKYHTPKAHFSYILEELNML